MSRSKHSDFAPEIGALLKRILPFTKGAYFLHQTVSFRFSYIQNTSKVKAQAEAKVASIEAQGKASAMGIMTRAEAYIYIYIYMYIHKCFIFV